MTSSLRRIGLILLLAITLLVATGCTGRMSYRFVDIWLSWSIKDYVTLTRSQNALLDSRMESLIQWHKTTQLPRYIAWLEDMRERLKQPMTADDFSAEFDRLNGFLDDIILRAEPDILSLLVTLDDKQLEELKRNLQRKNEQMLEEQRDMTSSSYYRQREASVKKNIQRWLGKLNHQQRVILKQWTHNLDNIGEERYTSRIAWQDIFFKALSKRDDYPAFQAAMQPILFQSERYRSDNYARQLAANQHVTFTMLSSIHQAMDKTQQQRLDGNIVGWIDTFTVLTQSR